MGVAHSLEGQVARACVVVPPLWQKALCLCWGVGEENGTRRLPCFHRSPQTHSEISMNISASHLPLVLYKLPFLRCLSMQAVVSLRAVTQPSLAFRHWPSRLTQC